MTHRLAANYAKNYCNRTPIVKVILENVVTCFFGTQCSRSIQCMFADLHLQIVFECVLVKQNCCKLQVLLFTCSC